MSGRWTGTLTVAVTYVFFLIFVQFGFLRLLEQSAASAVIPLALAAMGVAGLGSSLGTAALLRRRSSRRLVRLGLVGCAAAALAATVCASSSAFVVVAGGLGATTGLVTVALATDLRCWLGNAGYGLRVGLATGSAYAACNVPALFNASPRAQGWVAAAACLAVAALPGWGSPPGEASGEDSAAGNRRRGELGRGLGATSVLVAFLALVWLDSSAFSIIQHSPDLQGITWDGGRLWLLGASHLLGAAFAGWLIDRGILFAQLPAAFALFGVGFRLLAAGRPAGGPIYAVGIAIYSTALVAFPSFAPEGSGAWPRRWRAGLLYGIAGWAGSALGVGMAEELGAIPPLFLAVAGGVVLAGSLGAWGARWVALRRAVRRYGPAAVVALLAWAGVAAGRGDRKTLGTVAQVTGELPGAGATTQSRGRQVYIAEGCIHCHSQYVRPGTRDERLWGPFRPLDREIEVPALIGNRRLGPDLRNVGNRRSAVWQRRHLMEPRRLAPNSRMPSYAYLFAAGDRRGDDLVAYLGSLGRQTGRERYEAVSRTVEPPAAAAPSRIRGRALFLRHCAVCHGEEARGDGPLADELGGQALDLRKEGFHLVSWGPGIGSLDQGLARVIRFGIPTTSMPGHETLSTQEMADLVAYVGSLPGSGPGAGSGAESGGGRGR